MNNSSKEREMDDKRLRPLLRIQELKNILENLKSAEEILNYFTTIHKTYNGDILNLNDLHNSQYLKLKKYKQSIFYGEMQNGKRIGKGVMIYYTGRLYEGEWQNDSKFGRGFELYPNGNRYEGYFVNGKPEGMGTYMWFNSEIYDGQWMGGMKHGLGMWRGQKGDSFTGEWKFGKADGYGVHIWVNGDRYEGQFKTCLKHGQGTEKFSNGDYYTGEYVNGRPEGLGEYFWKNGSIYKGQFKNGLRHGKGLWKKGNGANIDKYEGEYKNDKKCGYGHFQWASGNIYKGEYFDDQRHGFGEMFWVDGSYYKGQWVRGIQSGEGQLYIPGEGTKKGSFINNVFVGNKNNLNDQQEEEHQQQENDKNLDLEGESFEQFKNHLNLDKEQFEFEKNQRKQSATSKIGVYQGQNQIRLPSKESEYLETKTNKSVNSIPIPIRTFTKGRDRCQTQSSTDESGRLFSNQGLKEKNKNITNSLEFSTQSQFQYKQNQLKPNYINNLNNSKECQMDQIYSIPPNSNSHKQKLPDILYRSYDVKLDSQNQPRRSLDFNIQNKKNQSIQEKAYNFSQEEILKNNNNQSFESKNNQKANNNLNNNNVRKNYLRYQQKNKQQLQQSNQQQKQTKQFDVNKMIQKQIEIQSQEQLINSNEKHNQYSQFDHNKYLESSENDLINQNFNNHNISNSNSRSVSASHINMEISQFHDKKEKATQATQTTQYNKKFYETNIKTSNNYHKVNDEQTNKIQTPNSTQFVFSRMLNYEKQRQNIHHSNSPNYQFQKLKRELPLTKHEIILWKKMKQKMNFQKNFLSNIYDPNTIIEIRKIIHPPVWKPAGAVKIFSFSPSPKNNDQITKIQSNARISTQIQ